MLSGKNIGYITLLAIAGVVIYYFFFRNKPTTVNKIVAPANAPTDSKVKTEVTNNSENSNNYVGPQDCSENCNLPYNNRILFCYDKRNGSGECLQKAEKYRQECLGKCTESLPPHKNLDQQVATPIQENNYFTNLFNQGYV